MLRTWVLVLTLCATAGGNLRAEGRRIQVHTADQIRGILAERLDGDALAQLRIPFEADEAIRAQALKLTAAAHGDEQKLSALRRYFKRQGYMERYDRDGLRTAIETFRDDEGNCVAYANLFVAMARAVGLQAFYLDASTTGDEFSKSGSVLVHYGHVLIGVRLGPNLVAIDFDGRAGDAHRFRVLSDFEAIADYYNNRGYALAWIHRERGGLGSEESLGAFRLATRIAPGFARAWNNLGVALGRRDRLDEAISAYRRAIAADASFPAPWANLGQLALREGDAATASRALLRAVELAPENPHFRYFLARALTDSGDLNKALAELEHGRALDESLFQIHMQMAEIYWKLGAEHEALAAARRVLQLVPGHRDASRLLEQIDPPQRKTDPDGDS